MRIAASDTALELTGATLGGHSLPSAVVSGNGAGYPDGPPPAVGHFGSDLLSTFTTITIDYADRHLVLSG